MNAAAYQNIEIALIDLDVSNHREVIEDQALKDLAHSIDTKGLQQPISVYKKPYGDHYTLGFGHRRLAAHVLLGRKSIQAIVNEPAAETEIRAAQAVENLHRADLTPLEEAQACLQLLQAIHDEAEPTEDALNQAAAMIGRTRNWLENRLALARLSPRVQELLKEGRIYLGHAQLIARLPDHEAQEEVAGMVEAQETYGERKGDMNPPDPIWKCRNLVQERLQDLTKVPWRLDAVFDGKPACDSCPHNSANQPGLFDGDQPKKPMCLDAKCFQEKSKLAGRAVIRASNTLSKMEKATPVNAEKALAEREAEFLKTAPVVKRAKSLGAPESAKSSTKSELKGKRSAQEDRAWKIAHEEALQDWQHRGEELIANVIQSSPARIAMAILLRFHQAWDAAISDWPDEKRIAAAVKKLKPFLTKLQKADGKSLIELAESLKPEPNNKVWPFDDWNGLGNPQMLEAVAAALNITLSKQPLEENFKQAAASGITKTTKRARAK